MPSFQGKLRLVDSFAESRAQPVPRGGLSRAFNAGVDGRAYVEIRADGSIHFGLFALHPHTAVSLLAATNSLQALLLEKINNSIQENSS
jgi:hypothetical protein